MRRSLVAALIAVVLLAVPVQAQKPEPVNTTAYAGQWSNKHFRLKITTNGHAVAEYGLATWCAPGVPQPCDTINSDGLIEWGGLAALTFTEAQPGTLIGYVDWSTTRGGTLESGEKIVLKFLADGTLDMGNEDGRVQIRLCGSVSASGTCG